MKYARIFSWLSIEGTSHISLQKPTYKKGYYKQPLKYQKYFNKSLLKKKGRKEKIKKIL